MAYIRINKEFFEKKKDTAWKNEIMTLGEKEATGYLFDDQIDSNTVLGGTEEIDEISDEGIIHTKAANSLGDFYFDIKLSDNDFTALISMAIKRLNKFKSLLESIK